ncbi:hypothetical protein Tco_1283286 [Tanacetum coccineum]
MYKEYLAKFWYSAKALEHSKVSFSVPTGGIYGEAGVNTFRNDIGAHYLAHSSEYVAPPSIDIVRPWFKTIGHGETVPVKGTLKKSLLPPRWSLANEINIDYASIFWEDIIKLNKRHREKVVPYTRFISLLMMHKMKEGYGDGELTLYPTLVFSVNNWALKPNQPEEPLFTDHMLAICSATEPVALRVPQGTKPGAQPGYKKQSTSSKQPSVSSKEATKGGSSKVPTSSKTGHFKKRKESSSAMDSNPSQPLVSTPVDTKMLKEDQQATSGLTSLGVTSEERANSQLSSGMSAFNLNKPIYSASFIIHSEPASGNDASAVSIAEADLGNSAPSDFVPQQQGMNEGTKNTSHDHLFAGTNPHVLADQTKSVSEGLETVLTQPITGKGASSVARQIKEETSSTIKLEDLAKLVSHVQPSFKDLDSPEDDYVIVVDDTDEDEKDEIHATTNDETEDTLVPKSLSPKSSQIQELTNQVLILQSQKHKLELEKNKAEAEVALLKAQPSFPNVEQLNELLVKSLKIEFSNILSAHEFSSSLPTELKDLPSKFNELTEEELSIEKKIHSPQTETTTPPIPPVIITTTTQIQSPSLQPPKGSSHPEGEHIKEDKGKKALSSEVVEEKIVEEAKVEAARHKGEMRKEELIDLLSPEVVRMSISSQLDAERGFNLDRPLSEQDPLDILNDLANKKRKNADDIHDFFRANKWLKSPVQYKDHPAGTVLNEPVLEIFFRLHQGPRLDDHARTFSSLLLAETDKRNLNPLKQMSVIEQLRQ